MSPSLPPRPAAGTPSVTAHLSSGQWRLGLLTGVSESPPPGRPSDTPRVVVGVSEVRGIRSQKASLPQFPYVSDEGWRVWEPWGGSGGL